MKHVKLFEQFVNETTQLYPKILKENVGVYISDINLGIIIKSLQKSKLVNRNVIENLIQKKM